MVYIVVDDGVCHRDAALIRNGINFEIVKMRIIREPDVAARRPFRSQLLPGQQPLLGFGKHLPKLVRARPIFGYDPALVPLVP